jgi:hypothetical protein
VRIIAIGGQVGCSIERPPRAEVLEHPSDPRSAIQLNWRMTTRGVIADQPIPVQVIHERLGQVVTD